MEGQLPANPRSPAFAEQVFPPHPPGGGAVGVRSGYTQAWALAARIGAFAAEPPHISKGKFVSGS